MIEEILEKDLKPSPQHGEIVKFSRRKPEDSNLKDLNDIRKLYDYIRMLDGEGYPRAFFDNNNIRFEFYEPLLKNGEIEARVLIKKKR